MNDVKLAQKGNKEAFCKLITESELLMYKITRTFFECDADCADAIQETIIKAYKSLHKLKEPLYFKTWLIRILINECKRVINSRKKIVLSDDLSSSIHYNTNFDKFELWQVVASLNDELSTVINLFYIEDLTLKQIAKILNKPEGTIKSRLSRARAQLAKLLAIPQ